MIKHANVLEHLDVGPHRVGELHVPELHLAAVMVVQSNEVDGSR